MSANQRSGEAGSCVEGRTHPTCNDCFEAGRNEARRERAQTQAQEIAVETDGRLLCVVCFVELEVGRFTTCGKRECSDECSRLKIPARSVAQKPRREANTVSRALFDSQNRLLLNAAQDRDRYLAELRRLRKVAAAAMEMYAACPADPDATVSYEVRVDAFLDALEAAGLRLPSESSSEGAK